MSGSKSPEQLGVITQVIMTVPGVELMNDPWNWRPPVIVVAAAVAVAVAAVVVGVFFLMFMYLHTSD